MDQGEIANRLVEIGIALSQERNLNHLLSQIVNHSMAFTNADAASLYVKKGDELEFTVTRNQTLEARPDFNLPFKKFSLPISPKSVAGYVALNHHSISIPDVYHREDQLPFGFDDSFDKRVDYRSKSMLVVPLIDNEDDVLGVLQLINHVEGDQVCAFPKELIRPVESLASQIAVSLRNMILMERVVQSQRETVYRLCRAAEARDNETGNHIKRVSHFAKLMSGSLGHDLQYQELIYDASPMHDIGKIGIPDAVLLKPGRLNDAERIVMNTHAQQGYDMLIGSDSELLNMGAVIAQTHHEKWDGTGYPKGTAGENIPIEGRITALVDVFDALSSARVYKPAWALEKVQDYLHEQKGKQFDPMLIDALFDKLDDYLEIREIYKDEFPEH